MNYTVLTILAGGFSRRFQKKRRKWKDKALISFHDVPILVHLLRKGTKYYPEISISVNSQSRKQKYQKILSKYDLPSMPEFIVDNKNSNFQGVLLGINSSLLKYNTKNIQFIPSDRPLIDLHILSKMNVNERGASFLYYENGLIEPLLCLYGSKLYFPHHFLELQLSRADVLIRLSPHLHTYDASKILKDNNLSSHIFNNINKPEDILLLEREMDELVDFSIPSPIIIQRLKSSQFQINEGKEKINESLHQLIENQNHYEAFLWCLYLTKRDMLSDEDFKYLAKNALEEEHKFWINRKLSFLALHALQDLQITFPQEKNGDLINEIKRLREKMDIKPRDNN